MRGLRRAGDAAAGAPTGCSAAGGPRAGTSSGLGHIDHRKAVVVDGRIGWVGGAGIEDHFEDGRFHDLFVRVDRPGRGAAAARLRRELPLARRRGARRPSSTRCSRRSTAGDGRVAARVLHNAPGRFRPITTAIARLLDGARETLDVVNPYVTDRGMIRRIERAARRGVRVRLFVPAEAEQLGVRGGAAASTTTRLLDAGVRILDYPAMLHAKAFVRDGEEVLAGTCNLEAWSLKRFFEIDLRLRLARARRSVRRALRRAGRGRVGARSAPRRHEEPRPRGRVRPALAVSLEA